jgi:hypothetical protein
MNNSTSLSNPFQTARSSKIDSACKAMPFNLDNMHKYTIKSRLDASFSPEVDHDSPLKKTIEKLTAQKDLKEGSRNLQRINTISGNTDTEL